MTALNVDQPLPGMPATAQIFRYEVPVDSDWQTVRLPGPIVHVATRRPDVVEVWATTHGFGAYDVDLMVVGTGHKYVATDVEHVGTAVVPGGAYVWHLIRRGPNRPVN